MQVPLLVHGAVEHGVEKGWEYWGFGFWLVGDSDILIRKNNFYNEGNIITVQSH